MINRTEQQQERINTAYTELQNLDPEIRDGLTVKPYHTPEVRKSILDRTKEYEAACIAFRNFCRVGVYAALEGTPRTEKATNVISITAGVNRVQTEVVTQVEKLRVA